MTKQQIAFVLRVLENEMINVSDAIDYEDYSHSWLSKVEMNKTLKKSINIIKKSLKPKKGKK